MARKPRIDLGGYTYHIIQRGNNREACFYADDDYQTYLHCMAEAGKRYHIHIHAYVLMTNHTHVLVSTETNGALSRFMQHIGRRYVRYFNYAYRRSGTLWEGRYKSSVVDAETYLLECYRYIELNPVRAGMTQLPSEYRWSSARWHGFGEPNGLIQDHPIYLALGATQDERCRAYRTLFRCAMDEEDIHRHRLGEVFSQEKILGGSRFEAQIINQAREAFEKELA